MFECRPFAGAKLNNEPFSSDFSSAHLPLSLSLSVVYSSCGFLACKFLITLLFTLALTFTVDSIMGKFRTEKPCSIKVLLGNYDDDITWVNSIFARMYFKMCGKAQFAKKVHKHKG